MGAGRARSEERGQEKCEKRKDRRSAFACIPAEPRPAGCRDNGPIRSKEVSNAFGSVARGDELIQLPRGQGRKVMHRLGALAA